MVKQLCEEQKQSSLLDKGHMILKYKESTHIKIKADLENYFCAQNIMVCPKATQMHSKVICNP